MNGAKRAADALWSMLGAGPTRADRIARIVVGIMTLLMLVMIVRVAQLQVAPSERLAEHIQERVTRRAVPAERGDILDRRGRYLATSQFGYRVFIDPVDFPDPPHEAIVSLADALEAHAGELGERIISRMAENQQRRAGQPPAHAQVPAGGRLSRLFAFARRKPANGAEQILLTSGPPEEIGPGAADDFAARDAAHDPAEGTLAGPRPLIRYVRISDVLDDARVAAVRNLGIRGVHLEQRPVRAYPGGEVVANIVGKVGIDHDGLLGAERTHNEALAGSSGRMLYVRDARGRPLWMGPGSYQPPQRGEHLRLSLDLEVQRIALEELRRGVDDADAAGGRIVVMDPLSGEVLAMADTVRNVPDAVPFPWRPARPPDESKSSAVEPPEQEELRPPPRQRYITIAPDDGRDRDPALARIRCVEDIYEPGSTFKIFVWAALTDAGLVSPDEVFNTEDGAWRTSYGRPIHDVVRRPKMTWTEVLVNSSNIGMVKATERMGFDDLRAAVRRFGFGSRTNIGLPGETGGIVTSRRNWSRFTHTSVAFGNEVAVTPVQMVRAFAAIARTGELAGTLPPVSLRAIGPDDAQRRVVHRIMKPETAALTRQTLRAAAENVERRMASDGHTPEGGWRYTMFGKSGTAQIPVGRPPPGKFAPPGAPAYYEDQYNSSFLAAGPLDEPRLVVLVVIDDPGPERRRNRTHYGSQVAGPVARRVLERSLSYMAVPSQSPAARLALDGSE